MKRYKYLTLVILTGIVLISTISCEFISYATIKVTNIGALQANIQFRFGSDLSVVIVHPGTFQIFEFEWPGHSEQSVIYKRYPERDDSKALIDYLTLKNGDNLEFQVNFN